MTKSDKWFIFSLLVEMIVGAILIFQLAWIGNPIVGMLGGIVVISCAYQAWNYECDYFCARKMEGI